MPMTTLLQKAFKRFENLPRNRQDEIASFLLNVSPKDFHISEEEESEWDNIVFSEQSQKYLDAMADEILNDTDEKNCIDADPSCLSQ